jgi:hypothetical protein
MMIPNCNGGEIILGEEVSVLWSVLCSGLSGKREAKGLPEGGVPEGS